MSLSVGFASTDVHLRCLIIVIITMFTCRQRYVGLGCKAGMVDGQGYSSLEWLKLHGAWTMWAADVVHAGIPRVRSHGIAQGPCHTDGVVRQDPHHSMEEKKRKDYAFRHQFNEKPSMIPGCPGTAWNNPLARATAAAAARMTVDMQRAL